MCLLGGVLQSVSARSTTTRHDAVQRGVNHNICHHIHLLVGKVRRYFQQQWAVLVLSATELEEWLQYSHHLLLLAGHIGLACGVEADVYGEVINILIQRAEQSQIIPRSILWLGCGVLGNVAADDYLAVVLLDVLNHALHAVAVDVGAVQYGVVFLELVYCRRCVVVLGSGCDCSNLNKAEAHSIHSVNECAVGVVASSQTYG